MDTIVALATPPGRAAIGVIRISGPDAVAITRALLDDETFLPTHANVVLRTLKNKSTKEAIDTALISYFQRPSSFTGEDVIELSCHGSPIILRLVIDLILDFGARPAKPGEFSLRALANGKLDLSEAEAIRDVIAAQTEASVKQAMRQLGGELSRRLQPMKQTLISVIVPLESALEFVEDDLPPISRNQISEALENLIGDITRLASTYKAGHLLRDGLRVVLVGPPNSGKSTLFNALLGLDRAIVTDVAGTTRDTLSEQMSIAGIPMLITDTAGIRKSTGSIESRGIERTRAAIADADLVVVVLDGTIPDHRVVLDDVPKDSPRIVALNKSDLAEFQDNVLGLDPDLKTISISAKEHVAIDALRSAMVEPFMEMDRGAGGLLITDARHYDLLSRASDELKASHQQLRSRTMEELILVGLHNALHSLGEISGETTANQVLAEIFNTFCIGK